MMPLIADALRKINQSNVFPSGSLFRLLHALFKNLPIAHENTCELKWLGENNCELLLTVTGPVFQTMQSPCSVLEVAHQVGLNIIHE